MEHLKVQRPVAQFEDLLDRVNELQILLVHDLIPGLSPATNKGNLWPCERIPVAGADKVETVRPDLREHRLGMAFVECRWRSLQQVSKPFILPRSRFDW